MDASTRWVVGILVAGIVVVGLYTGQHWGDESFVSKLIANTSGALLGAFVGVFLAESLTDQRRRGEMRAAENERQVARNAERAERAARHSALRPILVGSVLENSRNTMQVKLAVLDGTKQDWYWYRIFNPGASDATWNALREEFLSLASDHEERVVFVDFFGSLNLFDRHISTAYASGILDPAISARNEVVVAALQVLEHLALEVWSLGNKIINAFGTVEDRKRLDADLIH